MGGFGRPLVAVPTPGGSPGRAAARDRTPLNTRGGVGTKQYKEAGELPQTPMATEAGWSTAGWPGWWSGGTWPLAISVGSGWIPVAAALTPTHRADTAVAPRVRAPRPAAVRSIVGEIAAHAPEVRRRCAQAQRPLVATRRGPSPHHNAGVEVRRRFHHLRSHAMAPCKGVCKNVVAGRTPIPVKGRQRSQLLA
jgi:hypothetical protein